MKVIYGRNSTISSLGIRIFTWSDFHHVGIYLEETKTVIEALKNKGVVESSLSDFIARYPEYIIAEMPAKEGYEARARAQLGKPYDVSAIFGIVMRRNWESPNKWFCSELVAHASGIYNAAYIHRVTPQHNLLISTPEYK